MKRTSILSSIIILTLFVINFLESQVKTLPVQIGIRKAFNNRSYVLQIRNNANTPLSLWLISKGKKSTILIPANKLIDYGWAQGYHFDANNTFCIGGDGYDTIKNVMPSVELSPMRFEHREGGGFQLSFSQYYVQKKAEEFNFPIKKSLSPVEVEIKQVPRMELKEGSERMYAHCIIQASVIGQNISVPIYATLSFIPEYIPATGQLVASQIQIDKIDPGIFSQKYVDGATKIINELLPLIFSNYNLYTVPNTFLPLAKLFKVRDARVNYGRIELSMF